MRKLLLTVLATAALGFSSLAFAGTTPVSPNDAKAVDPGLRAAIKGDWRSAAHKQRDEYRHPRQTLEYFGIRPDMTVVELSPGGGWYTEILAPFLHDHGQLIEAAPPVTSASKFMRRMASAFIDKLKANPAVYGNVQVVPFMPPKQVKLGADGSADMVLTFRNTHDWLNESPEALANVFKAAYAVLKPGGVFGVVEHRARPNADAVRSSKKLHRIPEDYLIQLGIGTGFRLAGVSEINANPKDKHVVNVHRLPPNLAGPDSEHAKMEKIGESDRMTLKFVKPPANGCD